MLEPLKSATRSVGRRLFELSGGGELPDVLIIGAQKAGTTSLFSYLEQHPLVSGSRPKELHYFDKNFAKGERWYRSHFQRRRHGELLLEASPYYLFHPLAAERAAGLLPDAKLIVLLREPVARAHSHYQHEVDRGFETLSFEEAIACERRRLGDSESRLARGELVQSFEHQHFSYLSRGLYADQIERWLAHYPRDAFLFLKAEDMFASAQTAFDRACSFLDLPRIALADASPRHQRDYAPISESLRAELSDFYAEPNRRLAELTEISWS